MTRNRILFGSIIAATITVAIFAYLVIRHQISQVFVEPRQAATPTQPLPTPTLDPDRERSILLLGYGGANHDGGTLTDTIMLATINPRLQSIRLISIPRDLWVELPIGSSQPLFGKLNSAYPVGNDDRRYSQKPVEFTGPAGGGQMAKHIVASVTNITPDYFIAVDFAGFTKFIDKIGGIDLKIITPFTDPFYPLSIGVTDTCGKSSEEIVALSSTMSGEKLEHAFPCRYETLKFNIGTTHIDGQTALKFARSRHSPTNGGDFNRSLRQQQVITAVRDKIITSNLIGNLISLFQTLSSHVRTDMSLDVFEEFIRRAPEVSKYQVSSISLSDDNVLRPSFINKQSVLVPTSGPQDYSSIHQFITEQQSP